MISSVGARIWVVPAAPAAVAHCSNGGNKASPLRGGSQRGGGGYAPSEVANCQVTCARCIRKPFSGYHKPASEQLDVIAQERGHGLRALFFK